MSFLQILQRSLSERRIGASAEAKRKIKQYKTRGIIDLSTLNTDEYKNNWQKLEI
jgi:hypothetical protein